MKNFFSKTCWCAGLAIACSLQAYGQVDVVWNQTMGGSASDNLTTMTRTADGGYLLGGYSDSNASGEKTEDSRRDLEMGSPYSTDYWVVKTDAGGKKEWDRTFGGYDRDYLNQVLPTPDGGYLLAGLSWSEVSGDRTAASNGRSDYWLVKIDASGNKVWDKAYGGSGDDDFTTAIVTTDGNFLLGGFSNSDASETKSEDARGDRDFWVLKIDTEGNILWDKTYGGSSADELHAISLAPGGGFLLGGRSMSPVSGEKTEAARGEWFDYWVVRIDEAGNKHWDRTLGGDNNDVLYAITPSADGGFLLGGASNSGISADKTAPHRGFDDYWAVKIDAEGNKSWDASYGGESQDLLFDILPVAEGGYLLGGFSHSGISGNRTVPQKGFGDRWLVRVDAEGTTLWDTSIGGESYDNLWAMIATADGGALLGGPSLSGAGLDKSESNRGDADYWVVKIALEGETIITEPVVPGMAEILWDKAYGGTQSNELAEILPLPDGRVLLAGSSSAPPSGNKTAPNKGNSDYWLVMTDAGGNKLWDKSYGGNDYDLLTSVVLTPDGGFLLGGYSRSDASGDKSEDARADREFDTDMWVVKTDASGEIEWEKTYGGNLDDYLYDIALSPDGGFLLAGASQSSISYEKTAAPRGSYDYWLVKIDAEGNQLWDKAYGGSHRDLWTSIARAGNRYLLAGTSRSGVSGEKSEPSRGDSDYWLVLVDAEGHKIWDRTYGGNESEQLGAMLALNDGGFLIGGSSTSDASGEKSEDAKSFTDAWVLRLDAEGNILWDRTYGNGSVTDLAEGPDENFLIGGPFAEPVDDRSAPHYGMVDYALLNVSAASGSLEWDRSFGGNDRDYGPLLAWVTDGLLLGGTSYSGVSGNKTAEQIGSSANSNIWVVKVNLERDEPDTPAPEPTAGFVSGGGWFYSPPGAYQLDPFMAGRAIFSFSARRQNKGEEPEGHLTFFLPEARMQFRATEIDWLSVTDKQAFIQGTGQLGREEGYHFLLSVLDQGVRPGEAPDQLRLIIWDNNEDIVYDNQAGDARYALPLMPIDRGVITIHKQLTEKAGGLAWGREQAEENLTKGFRAYPTQLAKEGLWLELPPTPTPQKLQATIYNIEGRIMANRFLVSKEHAQKHHWMLANNNWPAGLYLLIIQGEQVLHQQKLIQK